MYGALDAIDEAASHERIGGQPLDLGHGLRDVRERQRGGDQEAARVPIGGLDEAVVDPGGEFGRSSGGQHRQPCRLRREHLDVDAGGVHRRHAHIVDPAHLLLGVEAPHGLEHEPDRRLFLCERDERGLKGVWREVRLEVDRRRRHAAAPAGSQRTGSAAS